jgi:hypothetical protein
LDLKPTEFPQLLSEKRQAHLTEERWWGKHLVLEYTRDNPYPKGKSQTLSYAAMFKSMNLFCKAHEMWLAIARVPFLICFSIHFAFLRKGKVL